MEGKEGAGRGQHAAALRPPWPLPPRAASDPPRRRSGNQGCTCARQEGCQETAIWERGQARTSWQQLRGAQRKPLDRTREERKCWRK